MKKSIYSSWQVRLLLVIFCILAVALSIYLFIDGFEEGREAMRRNGAR